MPQANLLATVRYLSYSQRIGAATSVLLSPTAPALPILQTANPANVKLASSGLGLTRPILEPAFALITQSLILQETIVSAILAQFGVVLLSAVTADLTL